MRCEATTKPKFAWLKGEIEWPQCKNNASVVIDDIHLCLQHAGTMAVQKLIAMVHCKFVKGNKTTVLCEINDKHTEHLKP